MSIPNEIHIQKVAEFVQVHAKGDFEILILDGCHHLIPCKRPRLSEAAQGTHSIPDSAAAPGQALPNTGTKSAAANSTHTAPPSSSLEEGDPSQDPAAQSPSVPNTLHRSSNDKQASADSAPTNTQDSTVDNPTQPVLPNTTQTQTTPSLFHAQRTAPCSTQTLTVIPAHIATATQTTPGLHHPSTPAALTAPATLVPESEARIPRAISHLDFNGSSPSTPAAHYPGLTMPILALPTPRYTPGSSAPCRMPVRGREEDNADITPNTRDMCTDPEHTGGHPITSSTDIVPVGRDAEDNCLVENASVEQATSHSIIAVSGEEENIISEAAAQEPARPSGLASEDNPKSNSIQLGSQQAKAVFDPLTQPWLRPESNQLWKALFMREFTTDDTLKQAVGAVVDEMADRQLQEYRALAVEQLQELVSVVVQATGRNAEVDMPDTTADDVPLELKQRLEAERELEEWFLAGCSKPNSWPTEQLLKEVLVEEGHELMEWTMPLRMGPAAPVSPSGLIKSVISSQQ